MRVLFAGTPEAALPTLEALIASEHDVVGVLTRADARKGRGRTLHPSPVAAMARDAELDVRTPATLKGEQTDDVRDSKGGPMRPHIVFFGEEVPLFPQAAEEMRDADVVIIVGTAMQVYPAASLIHYAPPDADCYLVDPNPQGVGAGVEVIAERAASGVPKLAEYLIGRAGGQS